MITEGSGKDVLLLHGYLSCKESFYYQINFLSKYYKVTAPDMPGFGASPPLDSAYAVGNYAEWLKEFIKKAEMETPHVIAHSFGARVAFKYLNENAAGVDKLVITGGAGIVKPRSPQYMRRVKAYRRVKKLFPKYAERHFGSAEYRSLTPIMKESYKKIVNEDLQDYARNITNRTLLLYGLDDTVTPYTEEGRTFNSLISGSRLQLMEGGHFCFCEHSDKFNELVYSFLTEN